MAVLDAKLPAWQASTKAVTPTKAEAKVLSGTAPLVIDGGGLGSGKRVLLKNQTKAEQNGLFEVTTNEAFGGTGIFGSTGKFAVGSEWVLTRTADADSSGEVTEGMLVPVEDGTTNRKTSWIQRTPGPIEVGVTAQTFESLVAGALGAAGGDLTGSYSEPSIAEAVIDNTNVSPEAAIGYGKLNLASKVAASDLALSAKQLSPQLVEPRESKTASGNVVVEMGAAETTTSFTMVTHGLGAKPKSISPSVSLEGGAIGGVFAELNNVGPTTFEVRAARPFGAPGVKTKFTIYWDASS
jgi:hypothetical protein